MAVGREDKNYLLVKVWLYLGTPHLTVLANLREAGGGEKATSIRNLELG